MIEGLALRDWGSRSRIQVVGFNIFRVGCDFNDSGFRVSCWGFEVEC